MSAILFYMQCYLIFFRVMYSFQITSLYRTRFQDNFKVIFFIFYVSISTNQAKRFMQAKEHQVIF